MIWTVAGPGRLGRSPAAFEVPGDSPERPAADRRNVKLWKAFGFHRFRQDETYFLDTATSVL
jgi:hypothetical protein